MTNDSTTAGQDKSAVRHSFLVIIGGQLERILGTITSIVMRKFLGPPEMGVYSGLRLYLDNTNRSSLGIALGAAQEIPILRAEGKEAEAQRLANVAFTVNSVTAVLYSLGLLVYVVLRLPYVEGKPYAEFWTWGLVAMAVMAPIKRYHDFLIVVLRSHQQFGLTTSLDVIDSIVYALILTVMLWFWGFAGLLGSIGVLMLFNIAYLHWMHPFRFGWAFDWRTVHRLFRVGLPIWFNALLFMVAISADKLAILWLDPDPERAAGLYGIAIMGTSWAMDLAGRIVLVMYTYFQTTLGQTKDPKAVAAQAIRATEAQAPLLFAGSAIAYLVGPVFLGLIMAEYAEGLIALRPLLPSMILIGLALGPRQVLITIDQSWKLAMVTALGTAALVAGAVVGELGWGFLGVAWGTSLGSLVFYLATTLLAYVPHLGWQGWIRHHLNLLKVFAWYACGAWLAAHLTLPPLNYWVDFTIRCSILLVWGLPALWIWAVGHQWGGLLDRWLRKDEK